MHVLVNELSYVSAKPDLKDSEIRKILVSVMDAIIFFRSLSPVNQVSFWISDFEIHLDDHKFLRGRKYDEFFGLLDREQRTVLLSMFHHLHHLDIDENDKVTHLPLALTTASVPAFLDKFHQNYGLLSLFSHVEWTKNSLSFSSLTGNICVRNWPQIKFDGNIEAYLSSAKEFFLPFLGQISTEENSILPYRKITNILLREETFAKYCESLPAGGKLASYQTIGTTVAELNGYRPRPDLNNINSSKQKKRNIFQNEKNKKFISIDYEKGVFEFLDSNGVHLGEFNFEGRKLHNADTSGGHDIKLNVK